MDGQIGPQEIARDLREPRTLEGRGEQGHLGCRVIRMGIAGVDGHSDGQAMLALDLKCY